MELRNLADSGFFEDILTNTNSEDSFLKVDGIFILRRSKTTAILSKVLFLLQTKLCGNFEVFSWLMLVGCMAVRILGNK